MFNCLHEAVLYSSTDLFFLGFFFAEMGNGLDSAEELYTDNSYDYYNTQGVGQ